MRVSQMSKMIVTKVTKVDAENLKAIYGENVELAVVLPSEGGKLSIITPRGVSENTVAKLALSKRDLKELSKMLKDDEDDVSVEFELMIPNN